MRNSRGKAGCPQKRGMTMQRIDFNKGWEYAHLGEEDRKAVELPHDAMLPEPCSPACPGGKNTGWVEGRDYVYEKTFRAEEAWKEGEAVLEFEGVYRNAKVYLNGEEAGGCRYGYSNFYVDLKPYLRFGQENAVRVEAFNADQPNSRWYSGAGIYRPVWLYLMPKEHILLNGIRIRTADYRTARISVSVQTNAAGNVLIEIMDGEKRVTEANMPANTTTELTVAGGELWSPVSPKLYTCRVTFGEDVREVLFGIREVSVDAEHGLLLNGERVILRGACVHHDNGILGAACYPEAEERKVRLLKENGYNAVRSAHNPCSEAMLEACDKLGVLILDEYADMWYIHKTKYDYASELGRQWRTDLKALVEKDYNHPSVIMYSIGNEVAETAEKRGVVLAKAMTDYLHTLDGRPVTCGINIFFNLLSSLGFGVYSDKKAEQAAETGKKPKKKSVGSEFFNDLAGLLGSDTMKIGATMPGCHAKSKRAFAAMDVAGYNYGILRYKRDLKRRRGRVILGSETFCSDARKFWLIAKEHPALIGDFVWAGIDYLGEVGIGAWEYSDYAPDFTGGAGWRTASSGRLDLTGRPWGEALYTQAAFGLIPVGLAAWRPDKAFERHSPSAWRMSNALPSWSWEGCEGKKTLVEVYTEGTRARLLLNGRPLGEKRVKKCGKAVFKVKYAPGELTAVAFGKNGEELGRTSLKSAEKGTRLTLVPERESAEQGGLLYIRLRYTDANGELKPLVRGKIAVEAEGGQLLGLGSAAPYNEAGYLSAETDTYYGEALAVVRAEGDIVFRAKSPFGNAEVRIPCKGGEEK